MMPEEAMRRAGAGGCAGLWHTDCITQAMSDESYVALLLWTICVLSFACGVAAITQHPEWFGA